MNNKTALKPLSWGPSFLVLLCIASMLYVTHYILVPNYTLRTGQPYLTGYLIAYVTTTGFVFFASLFAYRLEGNPFNWQNFKGRYRLRRISRADLLWTLILLIVISASYFGLGFTAKWLASFKLFAPHEAFPPDMSPEGVSNIKSGVLFGMSLKGHWWIVIVYFIGWVFNILGEEFLYRGWMLPRQELAFGKYAWAINGVVFTFQHTMQPWNLIAILPGALFMSFVLQKRKNTWIGIIQHGLMNLGLFIFVLRGDIG